MMKRNNKRKKYNQASERGKFNQASSRSLAARAAALAAALGDASLGSTRIRISLAVLDDGLLVISIIKIACQNGLFHSLFF